MQKNKNISFHIGDRVKIYDCEVGGISSYGTIATLDRTKEPLLFTFIENRRRYPIGVILDEESPIATHVLSYCNDETIRSESWVMGHGTHMWIGNIEEIHLDIPVICSNCAVKCEHKKERTKCPIVKSHPMLR